MYPLKTLAEMVWDGSDHMVNWSPDTSGTIATGVNCDVSQLSTCELIPQEAF